MKDAEIPDGIWNKYLKKYDQQFKIVKTEDGERKIICSGDNFITLYSMTDKLLLFYFSGGKSARAKNNLKKKLNQLRDKKGIYHKIHQEGDWELSIIFKESDLFRLVDAFKIRRRKRYSPEYRALLAQRAKDSRMWEKRKQKPTTKKDVQVQQTE